MILFHTKSCRKLHHQQLEEFDVPKMSTLTVKQMQWMKFSRYILPCKAVLHIVVIIRTKMIKMNRSKLWVLKYKHSNNKKYNLLFTRTSHLRVITDINVKRAAVVVVVIVRETVTIIITRMIRMRKRKRTILITTITTITHKMIRITVKLNEFDFHEWLRWFWRLHLWRDFYTD